MLWLLANAAPETREYIGLLLVGFGSYILLPFVAVLAHARTRLFPYLAVIVLIWLFLGAFVLGSGITPMGRGDIVTPEQRDAWFAQPWVGQFMRVWATGIVIGIPLTVVTWVFEHKTLSRPAKLLIKIIELALLPVGVWKFIQLVNS